MMRDAQLVYRVARSRRGWELSEETMPESVVHDEAVELLKAILAFWARGRPMRVARNLAIRWDEEEPRIGADPDVCLLSPPPPAAGDLRSLRTCLPGHEPPLLAIEVVSETNSQKDYAIAPEKHAALGTRELWVFDPLLAGPSAHGGPFRLQVWERGEGGRFERCYAGDGPAYSRLLEAQLVVVDGGRKLRLADDAAGARTWPTAEEAALTEKQAALTEKQAALTEKDAALARVAELEAALAKSRR